MDKQDKSPIWGQLGALYAIEPEYWDISGRHHQTTPTGYRKLLAAMGVPTQTLRQAQAHLKAALQQQQETLVPPVVVAQAQHPPTHIPIQLPFSGPIPLKVEIKREDNGEMVIEQTLDHPLVLDRLTAEGLPPKQNGPAKGAGVVGAGHTRVALPFPSGLAIGYYQLRVEGRHGKTKIAGECRLAICPSHCYLPPRLAWGGRAVGINLPLYGLHGQDSWGVGDFGLLGRFCALAARRLGASLVGLNPLHALFNRRPFNVSPYYPVSRLYKNPVYLDVEALTEYQASAGAKKLAKSAPFKKRLAAMAKKEGLDIALAWQAKREVLWLAFEDFLHGPWKTGQGGRVEAFQHYLRQQGEPLAHFALFCALDEFFHTHPEGARCWRDWPAGLHSPQLPEAKAMAQRLAPQLLFHQYLQFVVDEQLGQAADKARQTGLEIGLYQDLAIGIDPMGADAWANQELFSQGASAGAPPDPLGPDGQNWGLTPPIPHVMRQQGYRYFTQVVRQAMRHSGALRIDHMIGMDHLFWIPQDSPTAEGAYVSSGLDDLMGLIALESHLARTLVIGEDLGTVPPGLRDKMAAMGLLSTRLMVFERDGDRLKGSREYPEAAMASFASHDLHTLAGYWSGADLERRAALGLIKKGGLKEAKAWRQTEKERLLKLWLEEGLLPEATHPELLLLPKKDPVPEAVELALMAFLARTPSKIVMVNQEELLGETRQQNVPGTLNEENWSVKLAAPLEALEQEPHWIKRFEKFRQALAPALSQPHAEAATPATGLWEGPVAAKGMPPGDWAALLEHRCHDPHGLLAMHPSPSGQGMALYAWRPGAAACRMVQGPPGGPFGTARPMERFHPAGLFRLELPEATGPIGYLLQTEEEDGSTWSSLDPYTYLPTLSELDLYLLGEGTHRHAFDKMGAHPSRMQGVAGVRFAVWAPNAQGVSLVGGFNHWRAGAHPMRVLGSSGIWELFVPGLQEGELYKFALRQPSGAVVLKTDPYAFEAELRPRTASRVVRTDTHAWKDHDWMETRRKANWLERPLSIYEVHLGSWRRKGADGQDFLSYQELAAQLVPYVKEMGFTHIELLPVAEHPLDQSWGYQVVNFFAPTSRFGPHQDFQLFVDVCHQNNIGVILDWVPGHFPKDGHGLAYFDGTHLYNHADSRVGEHRAWGTYIFNYSRHEVRNFLISNALFWLERYHIDGLRVDAVASMLYMDYDRPDGEWLPNAFGGRENLEAVELLKELNIVVHERFPGAITLAEESTAWPGVSRPTYTGGLGFTMKWNMGWMHDTLDYFSKNPVYRKHHQNQLTFSLLYAFHENFVNVLSHDEVVHGKGSMIGRMPGDWWQQFANLRLLYSYMWAHPGKKLLFMGQEWGQWNEWNSGASLDWHLLELPTHQGLQRLLFDLNRLLAHTPSLYQKDYSWEGFEWIDCDDSESSVISFIRRGHQGPPMVWVFNLTPVPRMGYRIGLPMDGPWLERFNSDAQIYGGSGMGNGGRVEAEPQPWHGKVASVMLSLPPLGALALEPAEPEKGREPK